VHIAAFGIMMSKNVLTNKPTRDQNRLNLPINFIFPPAHQIQTASIIAESARKKAGDTINNDNKNSAFI